MEISYESPDVAWRGRGRPPRQATPQAIRTCQDTARLRKVATLRKTPEVTPEQIAELRADLRAAERALGGRVFIQEDTEAVHWYWRPARVEIEK